MKFLATLPLVLSLTSCYYAPHDPGYPPYYGRDSYGPPPRPPGAFPQYGPSAERPLPPERNAGNPPRRVEETPPAPAPPPRQNRPEYPVAESAGTPGRIISPYAPYNVIDVSAFKSGQLAKDPSNGKIFRVP